MKKDESRGRKFETSLAELERIVRELERGELPLEEGLELFERGVRLSRECQERLKEAERRIEVLLRDQDGAPLVSSFDEDAKMELSRGLDEIAEDENVF